MSPEEEPAGTQGSTGLSLGSCSDSAALGGPPMRRFSRGRSLFYAFTGHLEKRVECTFVRNQQTYEAGCLGRSKFWGEHKYREEQNGEVASN